jgi:hypothetical protein
VGLVKKQKLRGCCPIVCRFCERARFLAAHFVHVTKDKVRASGSPTPVTSGALRLCTPEQSKRAVFLTHLRAHALRGAICRCIFNTMDPLPLNEQPRSLATPRALVHPYAPRHELTVTAGCTCIVIRGHGPRVTASIIDQSETPRHAVTPAVFRTACMHVCAIACCLQRVRTLTRG